MAIGRIEAPVDYRELWGRLGNELGKLRYDQAVRCVHEQDLARVPRHQGAYDFVDQVLVLMDNLVKQAHIEAGNSIRFTEDE